MRKTSPAPSLGQDARMKPQPETNMPVKVAKSTPDADRVWAKLAIELGPLLVFFGTNAVAGIYAGTAAFAELNVPPGAPPLWKPIGTRQ